MKDFWKNKTFLWLAYGLGAVLVSYLKYNIRRSEEGYTAYENYLIFKNSFPHLWQGLNPYAAFPVEQWDLFKYSPAFALFMAPFSRLPDLPGLSLWNLLNAAVLLSAILCLPLQEKNHRVFMAWFVLPELVVSMQNSQSNGLAAGLMLWAWIAFERGQQRRAAGFVAAGAFLKIFGIFPALLALLYPRKRRFTAWLFAWLLFFTLLPLVFIAPSQLGQVYVWWWDLLREDHAASTGLSVQGWLATWFGWQAPKLGVTMAGLLVLLLSAFAAMHPKSGAQGRAPILLSASILIWVVIFNHKAESPTFVIAMCGVTLWYIISEKKTWEKVLLWTTFALVSLSPTDIFPRVLREQIVQPYVLKAVPCILIWGLVTIQLFRVSTFPKISNFRRSIKAEKMTFNDPNN